MFKLKRLFIPFLLFFALFICNATAFAEIGPIIDPIEEEMLVLNSVTGVPTTLTLTLSLDNQTVGIVQGGQVIHAVPFPEINKQDIKLSLQGEGRMNGARMVFSEVESELPILPILPEEELIEEEPNEEDPITEPEEPVGENPHADTHDEPIITDTIDESERPIEPTPEGETIGDNEDAEDIVDDATEGTECVDGIEVVTEDVVGAGDTNI